MTGFETLSFTQSGLKVTASADPQALTLSFDGAADLGLQAQLDTLLKEVHSLVSAQGVKEVVLDFLKLEFMTSSCFKSLVTWISTAQEVEAAKQYRIRFRSNPQILWQRRSLHVLQSFAPELITLE